MLSHEYKCVFIHQRKAAGISIFNSFGFDKRVENRELFNDGTLSTEWEKIGSELASGYTVFTVIRNPWSRFVSAWQYLGYYKDISLRKTLRELPTQGHSYRHLVRPQLSSLIDKNGRLVVDYILQYERLEDDFKKLCQIIGKPYKPLPNLNKTNHSDFKSYYNWLTKRKVGKLFSQDISFFGYDFSYKPASIPFDCAELKAHSFQK